METKGEMQHLEFEIPSRGLIGLRSQMLTATAGEAIMAHRFVAVSYTHLFFAKKRFGTAENVLYSKLRP